MALCDQLGEAMNKVAAANDAAWALVLATCLAQGVQPSAITRNQLQDHSQEDGEDIGVSNATEATLSVMFMDGKATTNEVYLSPKRYDLAVKVTVAIVAIGNEERGRVASIALVDAIAAAFDLDPTLGGVAQFSEMADNPEDGDADDMGAEARTEIITFQIDVADAKTARG